MTVGCASQSEKEERRQNAFDISGNYSPLTLSPSKLSFKIINESGRHDVKVEIGRDSFHTLELEAYQKRGLDSAKIKELTGNPILLGEGYFKDDPNGGENISDDFGETSKISITKRIQYDSVNQLTYTFSATIKKNEFILHGTFSISLNDNSTYITLLSLPFDCQNGTKFFQQYFGGWSGLVTPKDLNEKGLSSLKQLFIEESDTNNNDEQFSVRPAIKTLLYRGKAYLFESKVFSNQNLITQPSPSIEMRFVSNSSERLVFFGNMFSLGNLSGSIVKIDSGTEETLATFQFKKD